MRISPLTGRWVTFGQYKKDWEIRKKTFPQDEMPVEDITLFEGDKFADMFGTDDGIPPIVKKSVNQQRVNDMFHEFWNGELTQDEIDERIRNAAPEDIFLVMHELGCGFEIMEECDRSKPRELPKLKKTGNVYPFVCSQCTKCKMGNMGGGNIRRVRRVNGLGSPSRDIGYCTVRKEIVDATWNCNQHNLKLKRKRGF